MDPELVREFVIAGHGDLPKVKQLLSQHQELLNAAHQWGENDFETAIAAAAHVGNAEIAEYLLSAGAPLEICTAAMLGRVGEVERILAEDPSQINATGAHAIPLLTHAAFSDNLSLLQMLVGQGATAGASSALRYAVQRGNHQLVRWLLENTTTDLSEEDFQGNTPLKIAARRGDKEMERLLRENGATA